ncbi:MAG: 30S ribosomal protein S8 [Pseudomonadota bacterium]
MMTDPIADMLTRIRNANKARFETVDIPASKVKVSVAKILKDEGYIKNYKMVKDSKQGILQVFMKYGQKGAPVISEIKRISKPSIRVYVTKDDIPLIRNGLGLAILSTSKGIITDKEARKQQVGGEVICTFW